MDRDIRTRSFLVAGSIYCAYCGQVMEYHKDIDYHNNTDDSYYYCTCWKARLEEDMNEDIKKIKENYSKDLVVDTQVENRIRYEYEKGLLKNKYSIR